MAEYEAYKDSGAEWLGKVPAHWEIIRLQTQLDEVNEKNDPVKTTQILSLTNKLGVVPYEDKGNQGNKSKEDLSDYKIAYPNCIVANSMNILIGSVGLSQYYGCVSPVYYVFQAKTGANIEYLNYLFSMPSFQRELRKYANGILEIRLRVSSGNILKRKVAIPPADEQKAIVDYLNSETERIDAIIAEAKASIEEYKAWKASTIYEAVTKGLDPNVEMKDSGVSWIGIIPNGWKALRFKFAAKVKANLVNPENYPDYPQVAPDNIVKDAGVLLPCKTVSESGVISWNHLFIKGQILYSKIRPTLNKAVIAPFDGLCSADMYPIETDQNVRFMLYVILSKYFVQQVALCTADRVKMPKINQEELSDIQIALPPLMEQDDIAQCLDDYCEKFDSLIHEKEQLIADLESYKKSLIFEVVTGKRKVV